MRLFQVSLHLQSCRPKSQRYPSKLFGRNRCLSSLWRDSFLHFCRFYMNPQLKNFKYRCSNQGYFWSSYKALNVILSILFYSIIFCSFFYSALLYSNLLYAILFYSVLLYSILVYAIIFYSILFWIILFLSILLYSILFSILFYYILF